MLKVAVKLPALTGDVGEYLADVTALEAAGADAIWVDDNALEPWVMLGALGAVTHRVGLGYRLTSPDLWPAARLGPCAAAIQTLSRGRLVVGLPPQGAHEDQLAALRSAGARIFSVGSPSASADGVILAAESAGQLSGVAGAATETWAAIAAPPDRDAWKSTLSSYEAAGAIGVIVPWSVRLIDLLRNPEPDDRSDLLIATG